MSKSTRISRGYKIVLVGGVIFGISLSRLGDNNPLAIPFLIFSIIIIISGLYLEHKDKQQRKSSSSLSSPEKVKNQYEPYKEMEKLPPNTKIISDTRYCINCGHKITKQATFCPSCGTKQEE